MGKRSKGAKRSKRRKTGRKPFVPTAQQREQVQMLAGFGLRHTDIAKLVGINVSTLVKYFREELDTGVLKANAMVVQSLFRQATSGKSPGASIFWTKSRMGWKEQSVQELVGKGGGPIDSKITIEFVKPPARDGGKG